MIARAKLERRMRSTVKWIDRLKFERSVFKPPYMTQREINQHLEEFDWRIGALRLRVYRLRRLLAYHDAILNDREGYHVRG